MTGPVSLDQYLELVTSEHQDKPNYTAVLTAVLQPFVDEQNVLASMPDLYDLDVAVGVLLDVDGLWIGRSRNLQVPITDIYFSFDLPDSHLGFDEAIWYAPGDPLSEVDQLPDTVYRYVLQIVAAENSWQATLEDTIRVEAVMLDTANLFCFIKDNQDMSISIGYTGAISELVLAMLLQGYIDMRAAGVRVKDYYINTTGTKMFSFGTETDFLGGWGHGNWVTPTPPIIL